MTRYLFPPLSLEPMRTLCSLGALLLWAPATTAGAAGAQAQEFDFYARGPYRPAGPRPEVVTGDPAGAQQTMYPVMQRYLDTLLVTSSERVRIERWVESHEHPPIRASVI